MCMLPFAILGASWDDGCPSTFSLGCSQVICVSSQLQLFQKGRHPPEAGIALGGAERSPQSPCHPGQPICHAHAQRVGGVKWQPANRRALAEWLICHEHAQHGRSRMAICQSLCTG
eukprot:1160803-Pelagomonas_calceolata.AAC.15